MISAGFTNLVTQALASGREVDRFLDSGMETVSLLLCMLVDLVISCVALSADFWKSLFTVDLLEEPVDCWWLHDMEVSLRNKYRVISGFMRE